MDLLDDNAVGIIISSPSGHSPSKGFGLKKWKRIKRLTPRYKDKDAEDSCKLVLKRGLSAFTTPTKPLHLSSLNNFATVSGSSLDSRFALEASFAAGTDSDNSEDRSSRSSTAASAPKVTAALGYGQDKNRMKNLIAKNVPSSNGADNSKKHRGERNKIDDENSPSSLESDSRSSNFVFAQDAFSATSNDKQGGRSVNYCGENCGETYTSEQLFNDEVQTAYGKENVSEIEELSQDDLTAGSAWKDEKVKGKNHRGSPIHDPLIESIRAFQSVQEALEKEVHKLGAIGKESVSLHVNLVNYSSVPVDSTFTGFCEPSSSDQLASEKIGEKASSTLETSVPMMAQKVKQLESRLDEAKAVLSQKETQIAEMEAIVNQGKLPKEESGSGAESQREKMREMELEFEGLFQQKMEAEIEYLALTRGVAAIDRRKLIFEGKKSLMSDQGHALSQLKEAENKAAMLKKEAEKVEKYFEDIKGTEEIVKMQRKVCKISFCFFVQLILLLLLLFWLLVLELDLHSGVAVPT